MILPKEMIMRLALATLIGMPLVAIIIDRYSETVNLAESLVGPGTWYAQIMVGIGLGTIAGGVARWHIRRPYMQQVNVKYASLLGQFQLTRSEILFVSVCAGVGEELLFRGALQPFFGIILTAVAFVAIHGYLNPFDWRMSTYGLLMTFFIVLIGFSAEMYGLLSAIIAHAVIDVILLYNLQEEGEKLPVDEELQNNLSDHEQEK